MTDHESSRLNPLSAWASRHGLSLIEMTRLLGCHYRNSAGKPLTSERVRLLLLPPASPAFLAPKLPLMEAILRMTAGEVEPNSWADPSLLSLRQPEAAQADAPTSVK